MVGEEDDGLATGWHLHRPGDHPLARELAVGIRGQSLDRVALQADSYAVAARGDRPGGLVDAGEVAPAGTGAGHDVEHHLAVGEARLRCHLDDGERGWWRPDREQVTGARQRRTHARQGVGRTGTAHPRVGETRAAEVLDEGERPGGQHLEPPLPDVPTHPRPPRVEWPRRPTHPRDGWGGRCQVATRGGLVGVDEADRRARREQRGRVAVDVPQHGVGRADELPPAGGVLGVDATEIACESDGSGWDTCAWLAATRHVQARVAVDEVGEAGCEAPEPDPPRRAGVGADHLVAGQSGEVGDLVEVGPVVAHEDLDHDLSRVGRRGDRHGQAVRLVEALPADVRPPPGVPEHDEDGARPGHEVVDGLPHTRGALGEGPQVATQGERGIGVGHLDEQGCAAHRQQPGLHAQPAKGRISTPDCSSAARTARAIATAPGVSPWMHTDSARTSTSVPSTAVTRPSCPSRTTRAATSPGSWSTAPGSVRGTRRPSGVYPRSAKASVTARSPASDASSSTRLPGRPRTGSDVSTATTASTSARACASWWTTALYRAPCGFT